MRYAIDALVAVEIARGFVAVHPSHQLVGPGRLRSDAMAVLFAAVRARGMTEADARAGLDGLTAMRIRLLNDRVSRATAWSIASALDWEDLAPAEYLAVARLQADSLVATDAAVLAGAAAARGWDGVALSPLDALTRP